MIVIGMKLLQLNSKLLQLLLVLFSIVSVPVAVAVAPDPATIKNNAQGDNAKKYDFPAASDSCYSDNNEDDNDDGRIQIYWINMDSRQDRQRRMEDSYTTNAPWLEQVVNYKRRVSAFTCQDVYDMLTRTAISVYNL